ncbi:hypothetical protein DL1_07580 [Thioclava dalianensis]|uniref:Uncharacterized protein n=1 Tax=Thioclava dalianensis TaxID=1185766 RepID=A0A074U9U6_9RHOB|nr:Tad domain-containing protein [Thioclava dalianensis]KEP71462.1 hypothetical protein DL1_07580 [Thioclava dalianensis]SFM79968.1 Flp pilus assembly protein TadG [Thioclava dalianensis]
MMNPRLTKLLGKTGFGRTNRIARFARDEDGALILLSLQLLIVMLVITGIAIDLVRQEERRTVIQATLDRATLAAADLDQTLDPKEVVKDYIKKAGLSYLDVDPVVKQGQYDEYRRVTAEVTDNMPTIFGGLLGIKSLKTLGKSQAEEAIGNVEVSMVLDISGSMNFNIYHDSQTKVVQTQYGYQYEANAYAGTYPTRMDRLQPAAVDFVKGLYDQVQPPGSPAGRLSISIVPYNQQVTLGSTLGNIYNLSDDHTKNTCVDVQTLGFNSLAISPTDELQRTMFGDSFDYNGQKPQWNVATMASNQNCKENSSSSVMAFEDDEQATINKINQLSPGGDTAIDIGARWGLALLDPSAQPVSQALYNQNKIGPAMTSHPMQYADASTTADKTALKIMVLMTDGENTRSFSTKMPYRTGPSGFFSTTNDTTFSANNTNDLYWFSQKREDDGLRPYYRFQDKKWLAKNEIGTTKQVCQRKWVSRGRHGGYWKDVCTEEFVALDLYSITWQTIWSKNYSLQYVIRKFLVPPREDIDGADEATIYDEMAIQSQFATKNANLKSICDLAKSKEIKIFTIAVDAPDSGKQVLDDCAYRPSFAYDVSSDNLADAFKSINSSINALRLSN